MSVTSLLRRGAGCAAVGLLVAVLAGGVRAQSGAVPVEPSADGDTSPVVAEVDGHPIHLDEVGDYIRGLPGAGGANSFSTLFPAVLRRLIEREALVLRAYNEGIADQPEVRRHVQEATAKVLETEYLRRKIAPTITESDLLARYKAEIAGKPGPEEVHALVIRVPTRGQAENVIAALAAGADFAAMARKFSVDATASAGGDLGFIRRSSVSPDIASVLFSLRTGDVTSYPVRTPAGWFVLKVDGRGQAPTPSFAEARQGLLEQMMRERVPALAASVVRSSTIQVFGMAGRSAGVSR